MTDASPPTERASLLIKPAWIDRTKPLDWFRGRFGNVYPGEGFSATLLALNAFLLMTVLFLLKTLRESLIVTEGGATARSCAGVIQAFILIFAVVAYGILASRLDRAKLISTVTAFGVFNLLVISQFWSFSTDVYSEEQGKRLFPFIGAGSVPGALACGALVLVASLAVTAMVNKFVRNCGGPQAIIASLPVGKQGGFELMRGSRYLLLVAVCTLFSSMISTSGDFLLSAQVQAEAGAGLGLQITGFLQLNVFLCFVWIAVAVLLVREAGRLKATRPAWRIAVVDE